MENALLKKLLIKSGYSVSVLNAPENSAAIFTGLPADVSFKFDNTNDTDALLIFVKTRSELDETIKQNLNKVTSVSIVWILYPKKSSKIKTDLDLMRTWEEDFGKYNLSPCASAAINETWTALRIKLKEAVKPSGLANADIKNSHFASYIDVENKLIIKLPEDFEALLNCNLSARLFFDKLSYSNQKEYLLWILTAKQEKTRNSRLEKSIDLLSKCAKNPNDKQ